MQSWQKYWQLFWRFRALRLMKMMEYRGNFLFWTLVSVVWTFFNFFFFDLILGARQSLAGWTRAEMYILLAVFTMLDSFSWSFFYHNMREYVSSIFSGQLNITLTKPIDAQYLLSVQENSYTNVPRFFIGLWILVTTMQSAQLTVSVSALLGFLLFFGLSVLFTYCLWFLLATVSFWVDRLENINEIVPGTRRIWQVPKEVFTGITSTILTVVLPLALISALPSELLLGHADWRWLLYYAAVVVLFFWLSRWFFHRSLRQYAGTGN